MQTDSQTACAPPGSHQRLVPLPGQPLCKHYSGAPPENLDGNYTCKCLAGVPYEIFPSNMERWPCRRRNITGLEQAECSLKYYGSELSNDVDEQVTEMARRAVGQGNAPDQRPGANT